ncbi:serine/arginine-rich splicing factor SR45a-like [Ananas comosus]|uniref:Serine/arginine-rich splicing factor SR45a-like n=1 Tax=Ananas comosus TaxID=4615 RepID=A0A6P5GX02_ANACO|nr:serine/arginine-rich splicing factor SR45a-like [Ananas comosus]
MADSPRKRYSRSPSPYRGRSRSRSLSRGRSPSRSRSPIPRSRTRSRSGSRGRAEAVNTGNTLYVTGLSSRVTERDLEDHFTKEGKVVGCHLVVEPRTRASRGFAFVTMDTIEDAERCIKYLNQSVLEGRYITVEKKTLLKLCAANQDDEFIDFNLKSLQLDEWTALVGLPCITSTKHSKFPT